MAQDTVAGRVRLHRNREARVAGGHLWVYEGEIGAVDGHPAPGDIVDVVTGRGRFLGRGYFNAASKIRARILTHQDEPINGAFFERRLRAAALRQRVVSETTAFRLVFGEGDFLPGLAVDRFGDVLVMQSGADAVEAARSNAARNTLAARCTYQQADAFDALRRHGASGFRCGMPILDPPAFACTKAMVPKGSPATRRSTCRPSNCCAPKEYWSVARAPGTWTRGCSVGRVRCGAGCEARPPPDRVPLAGARSSDAGGDAGDALSEVPDPAGVLVAPLTTRACVCPPRRGSPGLREWGTKE